MHHASWKNRLSASRLAVRLAEVFRFGVAGIATEVVYFGLLWLTGAFETYAMWIRATLAYAGSMGVNYSLQRSFTFRSQKTHGYSGPRYLSVQFGGLVINSTVLWITIDVLQAPFIPSQAGAIVLVASWSYIGQKLWAF